MQFPVPVPTLKDVQVPRDDTVFSSDPSFSSWMQSSWPRRFVDAETAAELGLRRGAGGLFDERRLDGAEGKRGQGADGDSSSVLDSHELRRATREMEAQDSSWVSDMNATWADPCMPPPGRPGWYPSAPAAAAAHLALRPRRRRTRGAAAAAHARGAARRSYPHPEWDADRALWRAASAGDNRGAASPRSAPDPPPPPLPTVAPTHVPTVHSLCCPTAAARAGGLTRGGLPAGAQGCSRRCAGSGRT